jgi:hypothetical protein
MVIPAPWRHPPKRIFCLSAGQNSFGHIIVSAEHCQKIGSQSYPRSA